MEYCGDFGSSMSHQSWIGQQDHPSYPPFAHSSTYPKPYYNCSPYFQSYYPPHPHPNCFTQTLYPHSTPPNYCYEHQTPIQNSCKQGGSTILSEQHLDGLPHHYGFDNLTRQSVFLADGSEHSFYALPEDYPLEQATPPMSPPAGKNVGVTVALSVAAQAAGLAPVLCSQANSTAGSESLLVPNLQLSRNVQDASQVFKETSAYDIYEEEDSDSVLDFTFELPQQDDERARNSSVLKASNSLVTRSSQLSIEHSISKLRLLWDPGASIPFISSKIQHLDQALQLAKHAATLACSSATSFTECKCLLFWVQNNIFLCQESEHGMAAYIPWDPGVLSMILDKSTVAHQVQFVQRTVELSFLSLTGCMQYIASNGINPVLHATVLNMQRAAHLSQGNYLFSLYCKSVLKTEYCQMRCLWKFSIKLATRLLWDPGVFTHVLQPIVASAIKCSYAFALEWTEVKIAAVLVLVVPCSKVEVTKQRLPLEFLLMDEMLQNVSEFRVGQLTYMAQSPAPNFSALLRPMVTVLYCWLPSFENKAKLQWDPGIALPWYIYSWLEICRAGQKTAVTFSFVLLFHCHQDPKLAGTALWLITFNPP